MSVKMVVLAPMPSARERAAMSVNPGVLSSRRAPYRKSCRSVDMRGRIAELRDGSKTMPPSHGRSASAIYQLKRVTS